MAALKGFLAALVVVATAALALAALALAGVVGGEDEPPASYAGSPITIDGLTIPARAGPQYVELAIDGTFEPRFWPGVNLGSTVPGTFPGEVAATRAEYDRWLPEMGELGVRVIRIYTILRPDFYDALRAYNLEHADEPIYVVHGVWIPEEEFLTTQDVYSPEVTEEFEAELERVVSVVHGDADLPLQPGYAGGRYRSDISPWVLAWALGIEWDPTATNASDRKNAGAPPFEGTYVRSTADATPMESWLASMLDHVATLEAERGWSRPLTFTNWLTTDPLEHPYEPFQQEDLVAIDPMHVQATDAWPGGFFATYHVYPYYPDFMRLTPDYLDYRRPRDGAVDSYAGYLHALKAHHEGQAVMVTEFAVPTGLGIAHRGPQGRDQGGHSEEEAGTISADLLRDIEDEGFAGGIYFMWLDEWFKFTWNTVDYELPWDRRQLWRNTLTNEEHFGVVATEPGVRPVVVVDGDDGEWESNESQVIAEADGPVQEVRAVKDPEYLYLRLRLAEPDAWQDEQITIGFDLRPEGNRGLPGTNGLDPDAEIAVTIGPGDKAQLLQATWVDALSVLYGIKFDYVDVDPADARPGSGAWTPLRVILNKPYTVPVTGEERPTELADLSDLRWGTSDPDSEDFDARNLIEGDGQVLELRIPWMMLTFSDPSSRTLYVQQASGDIDTMQIDRVGISVAVGDTLTETAGYSWDEWSRIEWNERRKKSWNALHDAFEATARAPQ